jgi:hypothetical protein
MLGLLAAASAAHAYIGPGLGAGVIGTVLGILGSILLALVALLYYPIKRLVKRRRGPGSTAAARPETKPAD